MADYTFDGGYAPASRSMGASGSGSGAGGVSLANLAGAAASLALIVGVGLWGYGVLARDVSGVPVVQAMAGPMRVAPEDPGGTLADHQGLAVNNVAGNGAAEGPAQQLLLAPRPAGLAAEDVATGALVQMEQPVTEPMAASLADNAAAMELVPEGEPMAEDAAVDALLAQLTGSDEPLTPLAEHTPSADSPFVDNVQDVTSAGADVEETTTSTTTAELEEDLPKPGPGLARSLKPRLRPSGLQTASLGPVDPAVVAAAVANVTEVDPASLPAGTRLVQIGAFDSPETARSEWQRLEVRFGDFLEGKARVIQKAQAGGRTFYRLRAHGFADLSDARRFCAAFVADKVDCIPVVSK